MSSELSIYHRLRVMGVRPFLSHMSMYIEISVPSNSGVSSALLPVGGHFYFLFLFVFNF